MRYLAIDLGDKRTGVAVGDDETGLCAPERVIEAPMVGGVMSDRLVSELRRAVEAFGPGALVVGLPLNMDGTESGRSKLARGAAVALERELGLPVHLQDERLTSSDAEWSLAQSGLTHGRKKRLRDAVAAAVVLRDFLEKKAGESGGAAGGARPTGGG